MFTRPAKTLRPPLAVPPRPGPAPRCSSHLPGLWVTRHQRGFTHVRPSGLPLACAPGWSGNASASSLSFAPRSCPRRTSGRGLALNTGQKLCHRHHRPSSLQAHSHHATSCRTSSAQSSPTNNRISSPVPGCRIWPAACGRTISALMKQCSRPTRRAGTTSQQRSTLPATGRGTILSSGLQRARGRNSAHLPAATRHRVCRTATRLALIREGPLLAGDSCKLVRSKTAYTSASETSERTRGSRGSEDPDPVHR